MINKKTLFVLGVTISVALFSFSCKKDEDKAAPTITGVELGVENSMEVKQGEYLTIKADITAEAKIHTVTIEIYADETGDTAGSEWSYFKIHEEFDGFSSLNFVDSVMVLKNALSGKYIFKITVIDRDVNSGLESQKFDVIKGEPKFNSISGLVISGDGTKYIGTDQGLFTFNEDNATYTKVENGLQITALNTLALSPENIWLGSDAGAYNFTSETAYNTSNSEIHSNEIWNFSFDLSDRVFIATPAGVSIKDGSNWVLNPGKDEQFLEYDITSIGTATNEYTYVATNGMGVERFKYDVDGISGATIFDSDWTLLRTNTINCVYVYDSVQVYGTPEGAAIHYSHLTKWDWESYDTGDGLIDNNVISIVKDANDILWFGTKSGLSSLNGDIWTSYTKEGNNILSNEVMHLAAGSDGSVWFANNSGLCRFLNNEWTNFEK